MSDIFSFSKHSGWIKLHRCILDWRWYSDPNTFGLFVHLLLTVNLEDKYWRDTIIHCGEIVTSLNCLAEQCGLSKDQIRRLVHELEKTGEIARKTTNSYTIIKINNFDKYQGVGNGKKLSDNTIDNTPSAT
jgi:hypothetical protein